MTALACSCRSNKPETGSTPGARELSNLLGNAQDPRKYWIKVYRDDDGPRFIDANRVHLNQAEELEFITGRGSHAPMFDVWIRRNEHIPAVIDTLSEKNYIDFHAATKHGLVPIGPEPYYLKPKHIKDSVESFIGLFPKIRVGHMHMESVIMNARLENLTLGPLSRGINRPNPEIVLGHDFLQPFSFVQFDFVDEVIRLDTTTPYRPARPNVIAELDFVYGSQGLIVNGALEHYRGPMAIDVAGAYELAIPYPERPVETQLILGELVRRKIPVHDSVALGFYANSVPTIGNRLLQDFLVTLDNKRKKLYLELP